MAAWSRRARAAAWLGAGLLGLLVFASLIGRLDPLATSRYRFTPAEAEQTARRLLAGRGVAVPDQARVRVQMRRSARLADSLFRHDGVAMLRAQAARLPLYLWTVQLYRFDLDAGTMRDNVTVTFDGDGRLWELIPPPTDSRAAPSDTAALAVLDHLRDRESGVVAEVDSVRLLSDIEAVALARHHLRTTAFADLPLRSDSVARGEPGSRAVYFHLHDETDAPVYATVEVRHSGSLSSLRWSSVPPGRSEQNSPARRLFTALLLALLVGVLIAVLVQFVRHLVAKTVDMRSALRDGIGVGILAAIWWGSASFWGVRSSVADLTTGSVVFVVNLFIFATVGTLVGLAASGNAEAMLRPVLPGKLLTLELLRRGALGDRRLGWAFLRGAALAGLVLGVGTLAGFALPFYPGNVRLSNIGYGIVVTPGLMLAGWSGMLGVLGVLLLTVPLLGQGTPRTPLHWALVVTGGVLLALVVRTIDGIALDLDLLVYAALGVTAALATVRYDPLVGIVTFGLGGLAWSVCDLWLTGVDAPWDVWLVTLFVPAVLVAGAAVAAFGRRVMEADAYVPDYLADREERARMQHELAIAQEVQRRFLPQTMPRIEGLDVAAVCLPAYEVGGDLYDFVNLGAGRLVVVVGDVSGKGTQAAFVMTLLKGAIQTLAPEGHTPAEALRRLNRTVRANVPRGVFATLAYAVLDVPARRLTVARAGHNPVIVRRADGRVTLVQPPGLALGLADGSTFDRTVEDETVTLAPDDLVVLYTDGFSEAMNVARNLYTDERLADGFAARPVAAAQTVLDLTLDDVQAFIGTAPQHDDMTLVVLRLVG